MAIFVMLFILAVCDLALSLGVNIQVRISAYQTHIDPRFIDGKFYRKPIYPAFITQRLPRLSTKITKKKSEHFAGLATAREYEKK